MIHLLISGVGAVLPSLVLMVWIYRRDALPEPRRVLLVTFLLGVAIVVPVVIVELPLMFVGQSLPHYLLQAGFLAFVCAALTEECFKFLVLTRYSARHHAFDEPMDGVVYGVAASLGFATLENILYVLESGLGVAIFRAFTAVPGHAFFGVIAGYYVGQAHFNPYTRGTIWRGLGVATLLHGLYDFGLMGVMQLELAGSLAASDPQVGDVLIILLLLFISLSTLAVSGIWSWLIVARLRREQLAGMAAIVATPIDG